MFSSSGQYAAQPDRLIIHHLSDLHYQQNQQSKGRIAFNKYTRYLQELEAEKRPHLIVITGDLTENGDAGDLGALAASLSAIQPNTPITWAAQQPDMTSAQRICVVPGPNDITWNKDKDGKLGFQGFIEAFSGFSLPTLDGTLPASVSAANASTPVVVYPINTCYAPPTLPDEVKRELKLYRQSFRRFRGQYKGFTTPGLQKLLTSVTKRTANFRAQLRKDFLRLVEESQLTFLDAGMISESDLSAFTTWAQPQPQAQPPAKYPFKILVTHHPLLVQPDLSVRNLPAMRQRFQNLLSQAQSGGFLLALSGHIHKPQVLSDLSILANQNTRYPLRQIGAGSLGESSTFNEITATYSQEKSEWRFRIRMIDVTQPVATSSPALVLLNPTEDADKSTDEMRERFDRRQRFDRRVRSAMRQYSEDIVRDSPRSDKRELDKRDKEIQLPQTAMNTISDIIKETVFPEYTAIVSFFLKRKIAPQTPNPNPPGLAGLDRTPPQKDAFQMQTHYLAPENEDLQRLGYPSSLGAWAVILGRILEFPQVTTGQFMTKEDYIWLKESGKIPAIKDALDALITPAQPNTTQDQDEITRYRSLRNKLTELEGKRPDQIDDSLIVGTDIYQKAPRANETSPLPPFFSVPVPLRSTVIERPILPEMGVLNVNIFEKQDEREAKKTPLSPDDLAERKEMLSMLSDLIVTILCSSSALGNPKSVWE